MKKAVFVLCFSLYFSFYSNSQTSNVHLFPTDSAAWYDFSLVSWDYDLNYVVKTNSKYYYDGFENVNGLIYNKVYATTLSKCTGYCPGNDITYTPNYFTSILLRRLGNKVYVIYDYDIQTADTTEHLLYDYDIQVGDTFTSFIYQSPYPLVCVMVDSVLTNTGYRKQWNFVDHCVGGDTLKWTEGITSNFGLFYDKQYVYCSNFYATYNAYTQCFMYRDTFLLGGGYASCEDLLNAVYDKPASTLVSIFPNPATIEVTIKVGNITQNQHAELYSIAGNLLFSYNFSGTQFSIKRNGLPAGFYLLQISDGKNLTWHKIAFTD